MIHVALALVIGGMHVDAQPAIDSKLLNMAQSASRVQVFDCKLLPTPPISRSGLLRGRLIAVGKPKRLARADARRLLEQFQTIPDMWNVRAGEALMQPAILVRFHAKRDIDLTIDAIHGRLSLDDAKATGYANQVVRKPKDPLIKNLVAFLRKHTR